MNENTVKIPKGIYAITALTAISLFAVFLTVRHFPDWYALLSVGAFMLLFGHTTWSWFSLTMVRSREERMDDKE